MDLVIRDDGFDILLCYGSPQMFDRFSKGVFLDFP